MLLAWKDYLWNLSEFNPPWEEVSFLLAKLILGHADLPFSEGLVGLCSPPLGLHHISHTIPPGQARKL